MGTIWELFIRKKNSETGEDDLGEPSLVRPRSAVFLLLDFIVYAFIIILCFFHANVFFFSEGSTNTSPKFQIQYRCNKY